MQRVLQLVFQFFSCKMLVWNTLHSKFPKQSSKTLYFFLRKKSQEDGFYNIMSVLLVDLARAYWEPQLRRDQQQMIKAHFKPVL